MKLKELRKEHNITQLQLSNKIGVSRSAIAMYETNQTQPDLDVVKKIAEYFNVSIDYLLDNNDSNHSKVIKIPVLGVIPAGVPIEAIEDVLGYEEITPKLASTGEFFALKVKGDSMLPDIKNGDILIVRKQDDAENGDICVVMVNGNDATVKKIKKMESGLMLIPNNSDYETMFFGNEEIITKPVRIIGKAIEIRRSL